MRNEGPKRSVCRRKWDRSPLSERSFELHIWQGTRNDFGLNRRTRTVLKGFVDEMLGAAWTSATQSGNFSSCNTQLCFIRYVCCTSLFIYTSQSPLFAFVLAPKLIYTPTQTALYKRLTHSVYLKPSRSSFTHGQQEAEHQSTLTYYMTPLCDWFTGCYSHSWWYARRQCFPTIICRYEVAKWYLCFGRHCSIVHCL